MIKRIVSITKYLIIVLSVFVTSANAEDSWDFIVAPYLQIPAISGDASLGKIENADVDVGPDDIFDVFSYGAMLQAEAHHKSGFGFVFNYAFMKLEESVSGLQDRVQVEGDLFQGVMEGFLSHRQNFNKSTLDLYAGVRWWDFDVDLSAESQLADFSANRDASWVDPVVGLRYIPEIADDWKLLLQGDIGGFNVSSDSSYAATAGVLMNVSDATALSLLYKAVWVDYSKGDIGNADRFEFDTVTHGPILGLIFKL